MASHAVTVRRRRTIPGRGLQFARSTGGRLGLVLLAVVIAVAIFGPLLAPHSPTLTIGIPGQGPSSASPLGTDYVGRDVLSRVLYGGRSLIIMAAVATALAYVIGAAVGMFAGYRAGMPDTVIMRCVDVLLSFPPLLFILVLIAGAGSGVVSLVIAVAFVQIPGIARLIRTATLEVASRAYVEAAVMRGERTIALLRRDILPNIMASVLTDAGLRVTLSVLIISGVNFLGLGLQPPAADWGIMISENRVVISENALSVLAPTVMLALLTVGVNLTGDAIARGLGRASGAGRV